MSKCKGCGAEIEFVTVAKTGKKIPVNKEAKVIITDNGHFVRGREAHFSTCPHAAQFRKEKGATPTDANSGDSNARPDTSQQAEREPGQF